MRGIEGQAVIITGGASGIGAACAARFVAEGAFVTIADTQVGRAAALADELGNRCSHAWVDVTNEASISTAVDEAVEKHGKLDVMFANAGIFGAVGPIATSDTASVDLTLAINLRGVFLSLKHAARVMVPRGSGCIIATASPGGYIGGAGPHAYAASKAGVVGLTRSVAAELRPHGIRVNALVPGAVVSAMTAQVMAGDTGALDRAAEVMGWTGQISGPARPDDIAGAVVFAASEDGRYMTGSELFVDAGYTHASGKAQFAGERFGAIGAITGDGSTGGAR